jgi:hypothetical protein
VPYYQLSDFNDAGTAAGYAVKYTVNGTFLGSRPVLWYASTTTATELGVLGLDPNGRTSGGVSAINNNGIAVGNLLQYDDTGGYVGGRAVYWGPDGAAVDLNSLIDPASGWVLQTAEAISDTNWILGRGVYDPDGPGGIESYERPFLLQLPVVVPEPGVLASCIALFVSMLVSHRARIVGSARPALLNTPTCAACLLLCFSCSVSL